MVATFSIVVALILNLRGVVESAANPIQYVNTTDGLNSNFCRTVDESAVVFTCQTDLTLGIVVAVNTCKLCCVGLVYSETSLIRTPLGLLLAALFMEVSLFWRFYMYTCQCKGCHMGQSSGVLLKEAAAFRRCPLIEFSLWTISFFSCVLRAVNPV